MGEMKEKNKLKIAVATHKKFQMPTQAGYFPLHVGKADTRRSSRSMWAMIQEIIFQTKIRFSVN